MLWYNFLVHSEVVDFMAYPTLKFLTILSSKKWFVSYDYRDKNIKSNHILKYFFYNLIDEFEIKWFAKRKVKNIEYYRVKILKFVRSIIIFHIYKFFNLTVKFKVFLNARLKAPLFLFLKATLKITPLIMGPFWLALL